MFTDRIRHDAETRVREETRTISAFNIGGETIINDWNSEFQLSYSFAEQDDTDNADLTFRCEVRAKKDSCVNLKSPLVSGAVGEINFSNPRKLSWIREINFTHCTTY